jgi:hypothetical protein
MSPTDDVDESALVATLADGAVTNGPPGYKPTDPVSQDSAPFEGSPR